MYLSVKNISFSYDDSSTVLNDISFDLPKGDTMSVVGASGCGKSTLLRVIADLLSNKNGATLTGSVLVDGITPHQFRKTGKLAFMFQEPALLPNLTVKENIQIPLKILKEKSHKVDELIEMVGLEKFANYLPNRLSGGMKTRVALARSFITGPELLLLDEPFSSLDVAWKAELYRELNKLKERIGSTVLLVTHDINEAIALSNGKILIFGSHGSIISDLHINGQTDLAGQIKEMIISDRQLNQNIVL